MIDNRRCPSVQLRSRAHQRPTPSGPRWAIRSRIRSTMSGPELVPPGLNDPTMPHISALLRRPADDPPSPAACCPLVLATEVFEHRVVLAHGLGQLRFEL